MTSNQATESEPFVGAGPGDYAGRQTTIIEPHRGLFDLDLGAVWQYRELLYFLVWRDVKVRYKQTLIGAGWAVIQPVVTVAIFTVVFSIFARIPSDGLPYPLFAFAGLLPWTYFSQAIGRSSGSLVGSASLLKKVYFPRLLIPLASITLPLVDFLLSFLVLLGLMVWYQVVPTASIVFLPLFLLLALVTALAVGLWLSPLNVRYRDVMHGVPFLIQCWMYASPIVYPVSLVPEKWRMVYSLNPMVGVIEGFRWALLGTREPNYSAIAISAGMVLLLLVGGAAFFSRMEGSFADEV